MKMPLISKNKFNKIRKLLPPQKGRKRINDRVVISGIIFIIKSGTSWRYLPEFYGNWSTVYSRYRRWCKMGVFQKIFIHFSSKLKRRCIAMLDSTYVKAHRTASSMKYDGNDRKLGRSRGGITTKIHLLCDSDSKPKDVIITGGHVHDIKVAPEFIEENPMKTIIADKAYNSAKLRKQLEQKHIDACIPPKNNAKVQIQYDKNLYKTRHKIENMFARLKDWVGIAFRKNRCAYSYQAFVYIALFTIFF